MLLSPQSVLSVCFSPFLSKRLFGLQCHSEHIWPLSFLSIIIKSFLFLDGEPLGGRTISIVGKKKSYKALRPLGAEQDRNQRKHTVWKQARTKLGKASLSGHWEMICNVQQVVLCMPFCSYLAPLHVLKSCHCFTGLTLAKESPLSPKSIPGESTCLPHWVPGKQWHWYSQTDPPLTKTHTRQLVNLIQCLKPLPPPPVQFLVSLFKTISSSRN